MSNHSQQEIAIWATDGELMVGQPSFMARGGKSTGKGKGAPYLTEWREFRGMTAESLATKSGATDKSWISKRENRRVSITVEDLFKISKVLKCEVYELFFHPRADFNDRLTTSGYGLEQTGAVSSVLEGEMIPRDHLALVNMVLALPVEAIPTIGALILKISAVSGAAKPDPRGGETVA